MLLTKLPQRGEKGRLAGAWQAEWGTLTDLLRLIAPAAARVSVNRANVKSANIVLTAKLWRQNCALLGLKAKR